MNKPLCIDLFCGLGGWTEGFLTEGYECVGFDIERHDYGTGGYPGQLVLQDVRTLHGSQFKSASVIVASPPCQKYSYMAMPWSRAKKMRQEYLDGTRSIDELNELFNSCFRIAREAGLPLIVENVRGAQEWVGPAAWNYGSFYLWGDLPALMPMTFKVQKFNPDGTNHPQGSWFRIADSQNRGGRKVPGLNWSGSDKPGYVARAFNTTTEQRMAGRKSSANFHEYEKTGKPGRSFQSAAVADCFGWSKDSPLRDCSSSSRRKAASAHIAKIPYVLARHIAKCFKPEVYA